MTQLAPLRRGNSTLCSITVGPRSKKPQLKTTILHPFSIKNGPHDVFLTKLLFLYPGPSCSLFFYQLTTCTFAEQASPFSCMVFSWLLNSLSPERCTQSTFHYQKNRRLCLVRFRNFPPQWEPETPPRRDATSFCGPRPTATIFHLLLRELINWLSLSLQELVLLWPEGARWKRRRTDEAAVHQ